jgi:ribonuclease E
VPEPAAEAPAKRVRSRAKPAPVAEPAPEPPVAAAEPGPVQVTQAEPEPAPVTPAEPAPVPVAAVPQTLILAPEPVIEQAPAEDDGKPKKRGWWSLGR